MSKGKLPKNCYWRGKTIWAKKRVEGSVHRRSLETDDPRIAESRVRQFVEGLVAEAKFGDDRKTWKQAVAGWSAWAIQDTPFSEKTYRRYLTSLDQVDPWLEPLYVDEIDKTKVDEIVAGRRASGASVATIRRDLTAVSSVLRWCVDEDWTDQNAALAKLQSRRFKERRDPIILPDPAHISLVIERAPGLLAKMILAAKLTGCRQNELAGALRANFSHNRQQLTVIGKGNKRRTIDMSDAAFATFSALPAHLRSKFLFWHDDGEAYKNVASRFAAIVKVIEKEAHEKGTEFRRFRFHDLRHLYAVEYLKNGGNIYILQGQLGHSSVKTTEMYLEYLTPEEALAAKFGAQKAAQQ